MFGLIDFTQRMVAIWCNVDTGIVEPWWISNLLESLAYIANILGGTGVLHKVAKGDLKRKEILGNGIEPPQEVFDYIDKNADVIKAEADELLKRG